MRRLVTILAILTTGQILACGNAYQLRYFPLGISDDKIIVVETSLNRYWAKDTIGVTEDLRDRWRGIVTLKSLDKKGVFTIIKLIDSVDFLDRDYIKELKANFTKALIAANTLTNFIKADKQEMEFCNFKTECKLVTLQTDTVNKKIFIVTVDKRVNEIKYPQTVIEESESVGGISNQEFRINSIRKITIGTINLIIADIASGEEHNSQAELHPRNQQECLSPIDCIYSEIVLYHGLSFDLIIWN